MAQSSSPSSREADRSFEVHEVQWTREKSVRFWDSVSQIQGAFFSRLVGDTIIKTAARAGVPLRAGSVIDFGCGPGYLLDSLLRAGASCEGADVSGEALVALRARLRGDVRFRGATHITTLPSDLPSDGFDVVFFVEVIEQLVDADLEPTLAEIRRILKPGGWLVITTPNEEELARTPVMCPDCGCTFHAMQHVRRWSDESLTELMSACGFRHRTTKKLALRPTQLGTLAFSTATKALGRKPPNLLWIGTKV